jgi:hypothetical protein
MTNTPIPTPRGDEKPDEPKKPVFKIWAEVERCDYENDKYERVSEPHQLGVFKTQEEAERILNTLEHSLGDET